MKTLKKGILLAVVLLVATILVTGCSPEPSVQTLPPGTVYLNLEMDNPNPSLNMRATFTPGTTIDTFQQFRLEFLPTSGGAGTVVEYWDNRVGTQKRAGTVSLVAGVYTLEIIAYTDYSNTPTTIPPSAAAATATRTGIDVSTTGQNIGAVALLPYDPLEGDENGIFAWNIDASGISATITVASMTIRTLAGASVQAFNLLPAGDGWVNLTGVDFLEGYYYVDFTITAGLTRTFRHILHIYRGQTTTVSYEFTDAVLGLVSLTVTITGITYTPPTVTAPAVQIDGVPTPVAAGADVPVSLGGLAVTLSVTNAGVFTTTDITPVVQIEWFYGSNSLGTGASYTVNTATGPFATQGKYMITVTGTTEFDEDIPYSGVPSSTEFFIVVGP
jgi:hypothetical protein